MIMIVAAGLLWRSQMIPLSPFYHKYGGDALWALLIFLGFGFMFVRTPTLRVALMAFCFCCAVELTQLYHAPWIESLRGTRLGALTLGVVFNWPDMIAYGVGIIFGCLAEVTRHRNAI